MTIRDLVKKTERLAKMFPQKFDKRDRVLDLVEEMGELAQALLIVEKRKTTNDPAKRRTKRDIADALADMLYDMIMIARDYNLELEKEYEKMLISLEKRIRKGEFELKQ